MTAPDDILKQLQYMVIEETFRDDLNNMTQVFRRKEYNLNETVTNELDFLLGAVFAQILLKFTVYCMNRGIKPSLEQLEEFNIALFSKASEFKDLIKSLAGL